MIAVCVINRVVQISDTRSENNKRRLQLEKFSKFRFFLLPPPLFQYCFFGFFRGGDWIPGCLSATFSPSGKKQTEFSLHTPPPNSVQRRVASKRKNRVVNEKYPFKKSINYYYKVPKSLTLLPRLSEGGAHQERPAH